MNHKNAVASVNRLQEILRTVREALDRARQNRLVRGLGYALIIVLGFGAVINLVVGVIAGLQGEWLAAVGLLLLGGGLVLVCELLVDFIAEGEGSGSVSSQ